MLEFFLGQLAAFVTFFAFPAAQFLMLRRFAQKEGQPELWYLPSYGLRLVVRNIPRNRTLSKIRYRAVYRRVVRGRVPLSVATIQDQPLVNNDSFFLFPGIDQILVAFKLEKDDEGRLFFIHTGILGDENAQIPVSDEDTLIVDYVANLENWFNFDVKLSKRAELTGESMRKIYSEIGLGNREKCFSISRVRVVH